MPAPDDPRAPLAARRVLTFAAGQIPRGLLADHTLKPGTWAVLRVTAGRVVYVDAQERRTELDPHSSVVVPPVEPHRIEPSADAAIEIAFYDAAPVLQRD